MTSLSFTLDSDHCKEIPKEIGILTHLEEFMITAYGSGDKEVHLPNSIVNLTHLNLISFSGDVSSSSIELLLQNSKYVRRLFIDNNQKLEILPENICSSLNELFLVNNRNLLLTPKQSQLIQKKELPPISFRTIGLYRPRDASREIRSWM